MSWFVKKPTQAAEEEGYNSGWLGLDNVNPYAPGSDEFKAYNFGYLQGGLDADELESANSRLEAAYPYDEEEYYP